MPSHWEGNTELREYYSKITLDVEKRNSDNGDYASFDHVIPNDPSKAVLCSRIINHFKGLMTDVEFDRFVREVVDLNTRRQLFGLSPERTKSFLISLRNVVKYDKASYARARKSLKALSSSIRFARKEVVTPGETVDAKPAK